MLGIKPRTSCIFTKHSHNIICYLCFPLPLPQHCCCHWHLVFCLLLFFRFTFSFLFLPVSSFSSSFPFQWFIYGGKGSLFWCCWWLKGIHHLKASIPAEQKRMQFLQSRSLCSGVLWELQLIIVGPFSSVKCGHCTQQQNWKIGENLHCVKGCHGRV